MTRLWDYDCIVRYWNTFCQDRRMRYCAVLCDTVRYCAILCGTVRYCAVLCDTVRYCAILWSLVSRDSDPGAADLRSLDLLRPVIKWLSNHSMTWVHCILLCESELCLWHITYVLMLCAYKFNISFIIQMLVLTCGVQSLRKWRAGWFDGKLLRKCDGSRENVMFVNLRQRVNGVGLNNW
jgi:hypothetical protein